MIEKILSAPLNILRHQKKYMLMTLIFTLGFTLVFFPYEDLSDLITEMIAKNSNNQVFVQFDDLGIGFLPPSLKMSNVSVATAFLPTIKAERLFLAPSFSGLLAFKPGFSTAINGFLKGDVKLTYKAGKKVNENTQLQNLDLGLEKIDLLGLTKIAGLAFDLEGKLDAEVDTEFDPLFTEQPNGKYHLNINEFNFPATTIPTPMGPLPLPQMKLSQIKLVGTIKNGQFQIEKGEIGKLGDFINGTVSGNLGIRLMRLGNNVVPQFSGYSLNLDLNLDRTAEKNFGLFLSFIDRYKTVTGTGSRYALNVNGPNFQVPANFAPFSGK